MRELPGDESTFFQLGSQLKTTKLRNYVLTVAFRAACCDVCTTPGSSRRPARLGVATKSTSRHACRLADDEFD